MTINYHAIWKLVTQDHSKMSPYSVHGPDHWRRVERNGLILSSQPGVNVDVVRLFACFHDTKRVNDGHDPEHGSRAAAYATTLRGVAYDLTDDDFDRLIFACQWHTHEKHHDDPTIGACWDADRLDLGRVGMIPHASYMSTELGKQIATHGVIEPWLHLLPKSNSTV